MKIRKFSFIGVVVTLLAAFAIANPSFIEDTLSSHLPVDAIVSEASAGRSEGLSLSEAPNPNSIVDEHFDVSGSLSVHFIDVGNADAILVECNGVFALVDAGENNQGNLVVNYLLSQGVSELDFAIATHPHSDHIGGMDIVLDNIPTQRIYMPDASHETKTYYDLLTAIENHNVEAIVPTVGDIFYLDEAKVTVLSPAKNYEDLNDASIVVRIVFGNTSFLLTGDATRIAEEDMLVSGHVLGSDVLKVPHHGSYTSSSYVFLREVMPRFAVITSGAGNEYGHPHEEVTSRLSDLQKVHGTKTYRADLNGVIVITSDGDEITVLTER